MKTKKWHKFRASKNQFPTRMIEGSRASKRKGSLVIGRIAARAHLEKILGRSLADAIAENTRTEWVFKFPVGQVPARVTA